MTELKRCTRCVMPETWAGITFDEEGVCNICREHDKKVKIDWEARQKDLQNILGAAWLYSTSNRVKYDCLVGYSGGKDTAYTLWAMVKKYHMRPLAFTADHGFPLSPEGQYNLEEVPKILDVDHLRFTLGNGLRNALCKLGTEVIGDFCYHCHAGVGALPAKISKMFDIPLQVWGEPTAEYQSTGTGYSMTDPEEQNKEHYLKAFVGGHTPDKMIPPGYTAGDMSILEWPEGEFNLKPIYLGNYEPWDQREHVRIIIDELGWKPRKSETTYVDWDKVDCPWEDLREYQKYLRRGFGKVSFQASKDIRDGIISRDEAMELVEQYEGKTPSTVDAQITEIGMSRDEFDNTTCRSF